MPLDPDRLNPTDRVILDNLNKGRRTAAYIATETKYSKGSIRNRLITLAEHGYVEQLGGGLYELIEDPRIHDDP